MTLIADRIAHSARGQAAAAEGAIGEGGPTSD
jgi:hypothetical protein